MVTCETDFSRWLGYSNCQVIAGHADLKIQLHALLGLVLEPLGLDEVAGVGVIDVKSGALDITSGTFGGCPHYIHRHPLADRAFDFD